MNERIKELALQAGAGEWGDSVVPAMMDIEKFAELILQECCLVIDKHYEPVYDGKLLKRYFGIE